MIALVQRVSEAGVTVNGNPGEVIGPGLVVLLGIGREDRESSVGRLVKKILQLRIFNDERGRMNLSLLDVGGDALIVSQFTLLADTRKGNRPSYLMAAPPETAIPLYEMFIELFGRELRGHLATGEFGADMKVALVNDGPVTIWLES